MPDRAGIDGFERKALEERRLNKMAVEALGDAAGQDFLNYLKSITINQVSGPHISDTHLRHLEGQRYIVGIIEARIRAGHREKAKDG